MGKGERLRLLFIDDETSAIEDAVQELKSSVTNVNVCIEQDFSAVPDLMENFKPDIVVIDLVEQGPNADLDAPVGLEHVNLIWDKRFVPLIVYSGRLEHLNDEVKGHPLVEVVSKGSGSELRVAEKVLRMQPIVCSLDETRGKVESELSIVLKDVAPIVFESLELINGDALHMFERACIRRLAAMADEPAAAWGRQAAWEQYVFPPLSGDIRLGDVLQVADASVLAPDKFRVVLTPSCDLVNGVGGNAKVGSVLVARCCSNAEGLRRSGIMGARANTVKSRMLTQGFLASIVPVPALPDMIPSMMADLTDLELIPICEVRREGNGIYRIVASMDSPFRELVSWAYLQSAGRPGLPNRDLDSWADEIVASAKPEPGS